MPIPRLSPMIPGMISVMIKVAIPVNLGNLGNPAIPANPENPVNLEDPVSPANPANPARNLKVAPTRLPLRIPTIIPMKAVPSDS